MGTPVQRYASFHVDASTLRELPHGGVAVQGQITHPGVFKYRGAKGEARSEYRPDSEVFSPQSMTSFEDAPITIDHPRERGVSRKVSPETWRKDAVGHVRNVRREDGNVVADLVVMDAVAIHRIRDRKLKELSCGYTLEVDETPGMTPDGQRYDAVQRNITGNHVALLPPGLARGGRECVLRVDGNEEPLAEEGDPALRTTLPPDMPDPTSTSAELATALARVDSLTAELAAANAQLEDSTRLDSLVAERASLLTVAAANKIDPKGKTNRQIKAAVVAARSPSLRERADKLDDGALDAAFTVVMEKPAPAATAAHAALAATVVAAPGVTPNRADGANGPGDINAARERAAKANREAYDSVDTSHHIQLH